MADRIRPGAGDMFGWYRIDALLGRGGMGEVYRAYDSKRDRDVALKILSAQAADDGTFAARFRRECQVVAKLGEPHVIPIHDFGEIDGTLFLDMRLVDGENLRSVMSREGVLEPQRAIAIASQVASALAAAHAAGVVHRDVKPENILLSADDFAYLVDFGIAVSGDGDGRLTKTGMAIGSTAYMAPEQFDGAPITPATDEYALATVLYEMLTGRPAHGGSTVSEVLKSVLVGSVTPPSQLAGLPLAMDAVLDRGMSREPASRFSSTRELVAAASAALAGNRANATYAPTEVSTPSAPLAAQSAPVAGGPTQYAQPGYALSGPPGAQTPAQVQAQRSLTPLWISLAALVIGAVVIAVIFLTRGSGEDAVAGSPSTTTVTSQIEVSATEVPSTVTVQESRTPDYGAGLNTFQTCGRGRAAAVFTGYRTTSCGFATNVADQLGGVNPSSGSRTVTAWSPDTGSDHTVQCVAISDANRDPLWRCQGGASGLAVVYVYP